MSETEAREILGDTIQPDGGLYNLGHYIAYDPAADEVRLDDLFDVEELEAIVWWMKNSQNEASR